MFLTLLKLPMVPNEMYVGYSLSFKKENYNPSINGCNRVRYISLNQLKMYSIAFFLANVEFQDKVISSYFVVLQECHNQFYLGQFPPLVLLL